MSYSLPASTLVERDVHIRRITPLLVVLSLVAGLVALPSASRMNTEAGGIPIDYAPHQGVSAPDAVVE
jgi:hypothetical protein